MVKRSKKSPDRERRIYDEIIVDAYDEHEVSVTMRWEKRALAVPLSQVKPFDVDTGTAQAVEDWHYWVEMGHGF